ncbi:TPA: flippase [Vibrio cholerae]|nr:flippase [Vibrio cholerae]
MSLKKNFVWNIFGSCTPLAIGLFSIPYLINQLGVELFGILTLIWALVGYFSLFDFGLGRALTQIVSKYSGDEQRISIYSSLGLQIVSSLGILGMVLVGIAAILIPVSVLGIDESHLYDVKKALLLTAVGIPFTTITSATRGILEGFLKFRESNIIKLYLGIGNFVFPVFIVTFIDKTLYAVTFGLIIVRLTTLILSIVETRKVTQIKIVNPLNYREKLKELIDFGSWMTLSNLISPLMVTADRFIVSAVVGASVVAYYTVPFEVIVRILIIPAALTSAFFPYISNLIHNNLVTARKRYTEKLILITIIMSGICLFSVFFVKNALLLWVGADFAENSWVVAVVLLIGITFNGIAQMPHALTQATGNTKGVAIVHLYEFIIYIPLLYFSVYHFGIIGAAVAWAIRALIDLLLMLILSRVAINRLKPNTLIKGH